MAERRLFQEIADRIVELIREGAFPPGSRLPGERELSERFGVSRVTIREAEIALQASGWIKIKTGAGVYVANGGESGGGDQLPKVSAFELTEARSLFEAEAAALAATTIAEEDLDKLEALLAVMGDPGADEEQINAADREFHLIIAAASNNQAIIYLVKTMWRLRTELADVRTSHASVCRQDSAARDAEHREILEALRRRDPTGARLAMRRHFNRLLESMLDATEERELRELRERSAESRARVLLSARLA
jgi:DNA-binding FadR family transcriptional regulator